MKKISSFLVVLLLMLVSFTAGREYPRGDVNQDGQVSIKDVTCLIGYLMNGTWGDEPDPPHVYHDFVNLGLSSGTLWATTNVGANAPEEYGNFYAWGETKPKQVYSWENYKWSDGSNNTLTKYCTNSDYGTVDNNTELDPEDDAAYANWGQTWRMPTDKEWRELRTECTWEWTTNNGVNGFQITGPYGSSLFLPAAGYRIDSSITDVGSIGIYWSSTLDSTNTVNAYGVYFGLGYVAQHFNYRSYGFAVRAVRRM